jgi:hypothetical protein
MIPCPSGRHSSRIMYGREAIIGTIDLPGVLAVSLIFSKIKHFFIFYPVFSINISTGLIK